MLITSTELDITKIKLIIWDLDNTFWSGTLSEGQVASIPGNIDLVRELSKRGIVNSVCSKNDYTPCEAALREMGIWEYFVFPSIDWTPKSNRVHTIIADMNLRPANVLFLDDEPANLQRALLKSDALMCGTADTLCNELRNQLSRLPLDHTCKRLRQYQELQNKITAKKNYDSDEEFLKIAGIQVTIEYKCDDEYDRIYELINRTNQLNYTKQRRGKEEVANLLKDPKYRCGYVSCTDRFCDYGIVGFFALHPETNTLEHFLFSCRTIGMGVEQFVYAHLGYPQVTVAGEVVTPLHPTGCPDWIKLGTVSQEQAQSHTAPTRKILLKGPCDVSQIIPFFEERAIFDTEFAYVSQQKEGMYLESFNHTSQILLAADSTEEIRNELIATVPFIDEEYFDTKLFSGDYDYVIFSMLTDYGLGLYQHQQHPELVVAFGQYPVDYTNAECWNSVVNGWVQDRTSKKLIDQQYLRFVENFAPIGRISDDALLHNLQRIRDRLPKSTKLIFLNGAELAYPGECKPAHIDRHVLHKSMNALLEKFVADNRENCCIINVNDYLQSDKPYLDTINHYKKVVYYRLAGAIQKYIAGCDDTLNLKTKHPAVLFAESILEKVKRKASALKCRILR